MELNIEKFSPKKAELLTISEKYKSLTINGIEDKKGYEVVDEARKDLKRKRVEIQKTGKDLRDESNAFNKAVLKLEHDLVDIIEPLEIELKGKQDEIDTKKEMIKRMEVLPERKEKLKEINKEVDDEFILLLDDQKFQEFYNENKEIYLAEKEKQLKEEQLKIERAKEIELAKEQARIEAEEKSKRDLEIAKIKAEEDKRLAVEAEKNKSLEIERQRIEAEELKIKEENEKLAKEKIEKEKLEKTKAYQKFLQDNNYSKEDSSMYLQDTGSEMIIWKKINSFKK